MAEVPVPRYDNQNQHHYRLAELCAVAEEIAKETKRDSMIDYPSLGQVGLTNRIRAALIESAVGIEIDSLVAKILPAQAK